MTAVESVAYTAMYKVMSSMKVAILYCVQLRQWSLGKRSVPCE